MRRWKLSIAAGVVALALGGGWSPAPAQPAKDAAEPREIKLDPAHAQRLQNVMAPLIQHMNNPIPANQVKITLLADPHVNAANAGGGNFYVTSGLLEKANDVRLRAVLAHETAHADLGHVAKMETVAIGVQIGVVLLNEIWPATKAVTPIAGQLLANAYTRGEETQADAHGVEILKRAGYDGKAEMVDALTWLKQTEGDSGGFFATHPATGDRIEAVKRLP